MTSPDERVVLIDLENMVGTNPRPPVPRSRMAALLDAAGPCHHTVVTYTAPGSDTAASVLAALGVAPPWVEPGPDAAENALIKHATRMQADGCTRFTARSDDRAFPTLTDVGNTAWTSWSGKDTRSRPDRPTSHTASANRPDRTRPPRQAPLRRPWP